MKQLFTKLDGKKRNHFYDFTFDVVVVDVVVGVAVVGCIVVDVAVVIVQR